MNSLDVSELQKYQITRNNLKYEYYQKVLMKCHHKIKVSASNFETQCFIPIPEFILGIPKYSQKECIQYVMNKLIKDGLKVLFINPNIIYINWDIQYVKPPPPRKEITDKKDTNLLLKDIKDNNLLLMNNKPKKIEFKPTSDILTNKPNNSIYDPKLMDLLKNKTNNIL